MLGSGQLETIHPKHSLDCNWCGPIPSTVRFTGSAQTNEQRQITER